MGELIYRFITVVANLHDRINSINDSGGYYFTDKQLHFIVTGLFGMALIFVLYPIFKLLAKTGHTMVITWLYVFTVVIVLCFAIEIGQWYSGTGVMEREDIAYGITGFLVMFVIFAVLRGLYHGIKHFTTKDDSEDAGSRRGGNREGGRYEFDEYPEGKHYVQNGAGYSEQSSAVYSGQSGTGYSEQHAGQFGEQYNGQYGGNRESRYRPTIKG